MTTPSHSTDPVSDPAATYPTSNDTSAAPDGQRPASSSQEDMEPMSAWSVDPTAGEPDTAPDDGHGKLKAAALLAGATALANKVRQEAPKKVRDLQEKRAAGRYVIVTEVAGRPVVVGPYSSDQAARADGAKIPGVPHFVELLSPAAYAASQT